VSDLVTAFFERLGNLGVLLLASALLVGGLAGAAVVHHYDRLTSDTIASQHHNDKKDKADQKPAKKNKHDKHKPGQKQHQQDDHETD
jgi:ABC-type nickel/cobalt efflux system permease component RcnA